MLISEIKTKNIGFVSTVRRCDGWLVAATVLGKRDMTNIKTNDVNVLAYLPGCRAIRLSDSITRLKDCRRFLIHCELRVPNGGFGVRSDVARCVL